MTLQEIMQIPAGEREAKIFGGSLDRPSLDWMPEPEPAAPPEEIIREASKKVDLRTGIAVHRGRRLVFDVHRVGTIGGRQESVVGLLVGWGPA
jgi:hypothetical protein